MKKIVFAFLFFTATAFGEQFMLNNQTSYPVENKKIAIQWASSAQEVDMSNKALLYGDKFHSQSLQFLKQKGEITLTIPKKAAYFRVVLWSTGEGNPDFLTNWIDIVPGTTYTLEPDHLVPTVLMSGMGC